MAAVMRFDPASVATPTQTESASPDVTGRGESRTPTTKGTGMNTSDVLNEAANALERDGWQQGGLGCPGGPRCMMGAIRGVLGETTILTLADSPAYRALREYLGNDWVTDWNDAEGRTAAEVVEVLRAAAVIESARENTVARESVTA